MRLALASILFLMLGTLSCAQSDETRPRRPAPAFQGKSMDGTRFSNDLLKGKVVLIQFWATWCGYCRRDQPALEELISENRGKNLVVLAVSVDEDRPTVEGYLAQSPRTAKIVLTSDTNLTKIFSTRGFPTYLALDKDGKMAAAQEGAVGLKGMREMVSEAGLE